MRPGENSFVSASSLDEGMVVTLVRSAAGYSSRDVPEEGWFFLWLYCFTCFNLVIFRVALGEIIGPNHVRKVK